MSLTYSQTSNSVTSRPSATSNLCIDSEDRFRNIDDLRTASASNSSPYNFTISKNSTLLNGRITRIGLTEVVFPWCIPNINKKTNQIVFTWAPTANPTNTTSIQIAITIGFYTPSQIASVLQRAIREDVAELPEFTMVYGNVDNNDGDLIIQDYPVFNYDTNDADYMVLFTPIEENSAEYPYDLATTRQLFDVMGFSADNYVLSTRGHGGATLCQSTRYVDIVCSQLTANQALSDTTSQAINRSMLCRLYLAEPTGSQSTVQASSSTFTPPGCAPCIIYRNFTVPKMIMWAPDQPITGTLKIEVYDDSGAILSGSDIFDSGGFMKVNWSMTLQASEN